MSQTWHCVKVAKMSSVLNLTWVLFMHNNNNKGNNSALTWQDFDTQIQLVASHFFCNFDIPIGFKHYRQNQLKCTFWISMMHSDSVSCHVM